ncbi:MAG TPA: S8 family serine peptidase, partial [Pyrinomonadaceae bacterium]|nr:S8 family serine peptidase [Pyrinomonadaceae bacterium]
MLNPKLSRTSWLTCLLLTFSLFAAPLAGTRAQSIKRSSQGQSTERESSFEFKTLSQYGVDLTELARQGRLETNAGYESQIQRTLLTLARNAKNNPVLVGGQLAARNIIVEGVAEKIAGGDAPFNLLDKRVFSLNLQSLSSGVRGYEEFKARFENVLSEIKSAKGRIILFIDGIDTLVEDGGGVSSAVTRLEAALAHDELRVIGAATRDAFNQKIARREGLKGKLQEILLDATGDNLSDASDEEKDGVSESEAFVGDKVSPDLRDFVQNQSASSVSVILQGDALKSAALRSFLQQNSIRTTGAYNNLNAQVVEMPTRLVEQLSNLDQVSYLSLDRETASLDGHVEDTTGADAVRDVEKRNLNGTKQTVHVDGSGIGIAILDSGIYANHEAFLDSTGTKSRVIYSQDFTGEGRTDDPYGHGTHVASLAAGNGRIANGAYTGIAPDANIINLRVLNSKGIGKTSAILDAINWVLANRKSYNIRVVNLSLGSVAVSSYTNDPVCRAVRSLANAGIVVVAAAGNEGKDSAGKKVYGQIHSPGIEPSAITVGAANTFGTNKRDDDKVASYSSRGPTRSYWTDSNGVKHYDNLIKPDLIAPGNKLVGAESADCTLVQQNPGLDDDVSASPKADMMTLSGTSMATPIVAGSAALLLQINPNLTPNMVKYLLTSTAQPLAGFNMFEQGAGEINVEGAVMITEMVRADFSSNMSVGTPLFTQLPPVGATFGYTTIADYTFPWSGGVILNHTYAT